MRRYPSDAEWVDSRVSDLPPRWQRRLRRRWAQRSATDYVGANAELRDATTALLRVRIPVDASDAEICDAADHQAARCLERITLAATPQLARTAMERVCAGQGIQPPPAKMRDHPAIARMCCPLWWRRKLRAHKGSTVEAAAVRLGYVNRFRDLYVSDEQFRTRQQQNRRNAAMLAATVATNEDGQQFALEELVARSTANKAIRRGELMSRIRGFERLADSLGHQGLFITLTCPSRFHRYALVNDGRKAIDNPRYDARETPRTANKHLGKVWARARAALQRAGLHPYGFRIAEPQHDGTPHWHMLVFIAPDQVDELMATLRKYALQEAGNEPGADEHRCDFKLIDKTRGSAAGYIAKYVAKNIDGAHVGDDLEGRPASESALRVEAWASTWRIRQFQQVGGPPVGVWRELRRIPTLPADAPAHLVMAHQAANKRTRLDRDEAARVSWEDYCRAQGGPATGRRAPIKLARRAVDTLGRYGDGAQPRPVGVQTNGIPAGDATTTATPKSWLVESERRIWTIERKPGRRFDWRAPVAASAKPAQPRTRVNNCTAISADPTGTAAEEGPSAQIPEPVAPPNVSDQAGRKLRMELST